VKPIVVDASTIVEYLLRAPRGSHLLQLVSDVRQGHVRKKNLDSVEEAPVRLGVRLRQSVVDPQTVTLILNEPSVQKIPKVTGGL